MLDIVPHEDYNMLNEFHYGTIGGAIMRLNLRKRRKLYDLTQKEIAEKVGIARNTYTNIELGVKNPSLNVALKIKEVLSYFDDDIFLISDTAGEDRHNKETA